MNEKQFTTRLATYFNRDSEVVLPSSQLVNDLGFDSIELYELVLVLEDLIDRGIDPMAVAQMGTVHDVYLFLNEVGGQ